MTGIDRSEVPPTLEQNSRTPVVVVHGGAGAIPKDTLTEELRRGYVDALLEAVSLSYEHAVRGGHALDAVQIAVMAMESSPLFNAGIGAVFRSDGTHRQDASLMNGENGAFGAVAQLATTEHPIAAARCAYEARGERRGLFLCGDGADSLARENGAAQVENAAFATDARREQWLLAQEDDAVRLDHDGGLGTVGCVVLDGAGRLAAATSTGGMTNVEPARVGDSAIIGAGTFADARCAVSCTGDGEIFVAESVARRVAADVEAGRRLEDAACAALDALPVGSGGLIAVDREGHAVFPRNTVGMYRAMIDRDGCRFAFIHDEDR